MTPVGDVKRSRSSIFASARLGGAIGMPALSIPPYLPSLINDTIWFRLRFRHPHLPSRVVLPMRLAAPYSTSRHSYLHQVQLPSSASAEVQFPLLLSWTAATINVRRVYCKASGHHPSKAISNNNSSPLGGTQSSRPIRQTSSR